MALRSTRLDRSTQQKTKRQIIFFAVAIIALLFVLFEFGPYVLNSLSGVLSRKQTGNNVTIDKNTLEPPFINSIPEATDSAVIIVSGSSSYSDANIELFVNGNLYDSTSLSSDQKFSFDTVKLAEGNNAIFVKVKKGNIESDPSRTYSVVYSKGQPKLDVSTPTDGQQFKRGDQTIPVQGKTDPNNDVTVNDFKAIVDDNGNFTYYLNLKEGDNDVKVVATSRSGSKTEKTLKVKYSP